jgi:two-component system KDP operon response regulator KdpE
MDNRPLVLVADRQPELTRLVTLSLGREGFRVEAAQDGVSALERVSELNPDLLLLGAELLRGSGLDILGELRESHPLPVILLDEQSGAAAVRAGLDRGADDVVAKPFHPRELAARVRAVLRRHRQLLGGRRQVGRALVDLDRRLVELEGRPVRIGRVEWLLLEHLVTNEGRILLHEELLTRVWGPEFRDDVPYLRLWIGSLRRRLGIPAWEEGPIRTIQGMGYAFDPDESIPVMRSRRPHNGGRANGPGGEASKRGARPARSRAAGSACNTTATKG